MITLPPILIDKQRQLSLRTQQDLAKLQSDLNTALDKLYRQTQNEVIFATVTSIVELPLGDIGLAVNAPPAVTLLITIEGRVGNIDTLNAIIRNVLNSTK